MRMPGRKHRLATRRYAPWPRQRRSRIWQPWVQRKVAWAQQQAQACITLASLQAYTGEYGAQVAKRQTEMVDVVLRALGHVSLQPKWMALVREYAQALHYVSRRPGHLGVYRKVLIEGSELMVELVQLIPAHQLALAFIQCARRKRLDKFAKGHGA